MRKYIVTYIIPAAAFITTTMFFGFVAGFSIYVLLIAGTKNGNFEDGSSAVVR